MAVTASTDGTDRPVERPRCSAHRTNGEPCHNFPVHGATVCRKHGGGAPQVKAKAAQRILEAADPVSAELIRLALKGRSEAVRVQAARDLLDRAGFAARQMIQADVTVHNGDSKLDTEIERLLGRMAQLDAMGEGEVPVAPPRSA